MNHIEIAIQRSGGPVKLAAELGVSVQSVYFWRSGKRGLPLEHGASIERLTGGAVTRKDLWPGDWQRIWPELASATSSQQKQHPALDVQAVGAMAAQGV